MRNIEEQLELSRKTGFGIGKDVRFQENPNHKVSEGGKCPHCETYSNENILDEGVYETTETIKRTYKDREKAHWAQFWVVDYTCGNCNKKFSKVDGF